MPAVFLNLEGGSGAGAGANHCNAVAVHSDIGRVPAVPIVGMRAVHIQASERAHGSGHIG